MAVIKYRSVDDMPRPWRDVDDPENLRAVAEMLRFYRMLMPTASRPVGVRKFRTLEEANADRSDPYRR